MIQVLDNGFVRLEGHMGGDQAVVRAARVSYKNTEIVDVEKDRKLIAYMLAHEHGTPFEHAVFTFHVKCPIFVMRQWIRHRTSSYNETSFRYREVPNEFYVPSKWRAQDMKNKQGSITDAGDMRHQWFSDHLSHLTGRAMELYENMLKEGIAREMARMVLPVNLYTEFYWTVNARALMHFIGLRSEAHAQWETRQYSDALAGIFSEQMPWTADAFFKTLDPECYQFIKEA